MNETKRVIPWKSIQSAGREPLLDREWLVTNGLGGYASGTVGGVCTRRYHGLLIAALASPFGRMMMFNHLAEWIKHSDGRVLRIGGREQTGKLTLHNASSLIEFRLERGLPVWRYELDGAVIEKRVFMPHLQNTVYLSYKLISSSGPVQLGLRPSFCVRPHDAPVNAPLYAPYELTMREDRYEICPGPDLPAIRLHLRGEKATLLVSGGKQRNVFYRIEAARGYPDAGDLWSPGYFRATLSGDRPVSLVASIESWPTILSMSASQALQNSMERRKRLIQAAVPAAIEGPSAELVLAADQFVITPVGREQDTARAHSAGDEPRTVIAGYHWFTDWGRDTMISLEGLTLCTGRVTEAGFILRTFSHYIRNGLIPNYFPDGESEGLYHTADATLWFFHAIDRYVRTSGDRETLRAILPKLIDIAHHHLKGTKFGIHVDPNDGLLSQGAEGYQLTWMDAKVGDWVVTPRRGKAVEINALWYNALRLLEGWLREERGPKSAKSIGEAADKALASFNARFWNPKTGYLFDVVDGPNGDDPLCRPNQVFAISLPNPVLDPKHWNSVMDVVKAKLVTPVGLRSLAPGSPDYKPNYEGDLRSRDAAYHQGTVWAWLVGPYVDAWLKVYPDDIAGARSALDGFVAHLGDGCIGSISEIFDAEAPFTQRGCIAQAWSVAEVLRALIKTRNPGAMDRG